MIGAKTGVERFERNESAEEKPSANDKNKGKRHFESDQRAA